MGNPDAAVRKCRQVRVATVYGAAHGLGLYTNVLDLNNVLRDRVSDVQTLREGQTGGTPLKSDPVWPLVILVEEGKHASAPDRNGDGVFTPGYDVNRFAADAWGARDTMRTKIIAPVFRADTFKQRIPAISFENGEPKAADDSPWAQNLFKTQVSYDYTVKRATDDAEICGDPEKFLTENERNQVLERYAEDLKQQRGSGNPKELLRGKKFCDDASIHSRFNGIDLLQRIGVGGQYNGYTRFWERFSASFRFDGGFGWTGTIPIPVPVPSLGGVIVGRLAGPWFWNGRPEARHSIDALYTPSASRVADWYVAGGYDWGNYVKEEIHEDGKRTAVELGTRFRIPTQKFGTFLGARIGVRANTGTDRALSNARIIFEVGAGIW